MDARYARVLIAIASAIVLLLIVVVVIVAADGDGDGGTTQAAQSSTTSTTTAPPATTTTSSSSTTATTTTIPPTTTTTPPTTTTTSTTTTTTTTVPAGACAGLPSTPVSAGATDQTAAFGDVDGDGADDEMVVYRAAGSWWLNVELDYGWSTEIPLTGMVARAVEIVDLGVSEQVMIAQTDAGASVEIYGFFALQSCGVVHVTDGNTGLESAFPIGGTVTHLDGLTCTADGIRTTSAANDPNDATLWEYTETTYLYAPGLGELQPNASSIQMLVSPQDDATIYGASDFDC
jgi:hypothetical protein